MTATMNETTQSQFRSLESPIRMVSAANGVDYAFRELGDGAVPLVLLQHFRGNLDYWDPALIDALAVGRRVITFDNSGVGRSSGTTPSTVTQMASDASHSWPRSISIRWTSSGSPSAASSRKRSL
jgi:pimeloyl-ACP methyl ester carboxylesterase